MLHSNINVHCHIKAHAISRKTNSGFENWLQFVGLCFDKNVLPCRIEGIIARLSVPLSEKRCKYIKDNEVVFKLHTQQTVLKKK